LLSRGSTRAPLGGISVTGPNGIRGGRSRRGFPEGVLREALYWGSPLVQLTVTRGALGGGGARGVGGHRGVIEFVVWGEARYNGGGALFVEIGLLHKDILAQGWPSGPSGVVEGGFCGGLNLFNLEVSWEHQRKGQRVRKRLDKIICRKRRQSLGLVFNTKLCRITLATEVWRLEKL